MVPVEQRGYVHPEALVSTDWLAENLVDPSIRVFEVDEDTALYGQGHVSGAIELHWMRDLNDPVVRDYIDREQFERLMGGFGVCAETPVVLYGDRNNWWAAYALWLFSLFGHRDLRIVDGGRQKWIAEGRPLTKAIPTFEPALYRAKLRDDYRERAFRDEVLEHVKKHGKLVDVRSPEEFSGETSFLPEYPNEGALRGGHIPGAVNVPWARAVDAATGCIKGADELRKTYEFDAHLTPSDDLIVYCRIGERSSHTWFVLKYLLGFRHVRNYDGSWAEWGNLVGVPVAKSP